MIGTATLSPPRSLAGMGQIVFVANDATATTVLGSCVGVAIYDPAEMLGALAHIVLPRAEGRPGSPGKYVDTAIPWMIEALKQRGAVPRRLVAKLTGGAKMFTTQGPFLIGEQNAEATRCLLKQFRIPLVAEHVGGAQGRRATFVADTGQLSVEVVGQSIVIL